MILGSGLPSEDPSVRPADDLLSIVLLPRKIRRVRGDVRNSACSFQNERAGGVALDARDCEAHGFCSGRVSFIRVNAHEHRIGVGCKLATEISTGNQFPVSWKQSAELRGNPQRRPLGTA
jgi:hypothetical protein